MLIFWLILPILLFPLLLKVKAPYGRHNTPRFGFSFPYRLGWILMEAPALLSFLIAYWYNDPTSLSFLFFSLWSLHYLYRSFVYPIRSKGKPISWLIVFSAFLFNIVNGSLNGLFLGKHVYPMTWVYDLRFLVGLFFFILGALINFQSDEILLKLKRASTKYQIPYGGLFKYVSSPNYLGEITEWAGFALMTWSLPAFAFLLWTMSNLIARAIHHHSWYQKTFPDYPKERKILLPFLW